MIDDFDDRTLPLFSGPHIPRIRFEAALARLDLAAALVDAPHECRAGLQEMIAALGADGPAGADLQLLRHCRSEGWSPLLEQVWLRIVGLHLASMPIPGAMDGEPAGGFLLRAGDERAQEILRRHLEHSPCDARAWEHLAHFEPLRAAARCAFHHGPVLETHVVPLLDAIEEDEISPPGPWLLAYAWFAHALALNDLAVALRAENIVSEPSVCADDAHAFTWYLVEAQSSQPQAALAARRCLQRINPAAFRRFLDRIKGKMLE